MLLFLTFFFSPKNPHSPDYRIFMIVAPSLRQAIPTRFVGAFTFFGVCLSFGPRSLVFKYVETRTNDTINFTEKQRKSFACLNFFWIHRLIADSDNLSRSCQTCAILTFLRTATNAIVVQIILVGVGYCFSLVISSFFVCLLPLIYGFLVLCWT